MALVHAELTATCNSLGCAGAEKYCIDPQCSGIYLVINTVKPLNRGHSWSPTFCPLFRGDTFLKFICIIMYYTHIMLLLIIYCKLLHIII